MAALTLSLDTYRDKVFGGWQAKSAGVTLGAAQRGQMVPGRNNFYSPVPGQPVASIALDFPLIWLEVLDQVGPDVAPEDLAVAWLEHLDYSQDEFGYAALNLRRGLPPPASGAHSNWFRHATGGMMRADFWAMLAPGAPQVAAAYAYHDAKLDHSEDGVWAAMFLAAIGSAAFFLTDPLTLLTIGLAMIPRTCRSARAVKTALAAAQRGASWLEARESVQHEVGHKNFTDAPQNLGFFTMGLFYGLQDFGPSLCAAVNCGYDSEIVGGALGAILGILRGGSGLPADWTKPIGDIVIPGLGVRDFDAPMTLTDVTARMVGIGRRVVEARCPDVEIADAPPAPALLPDFAPSMAAPPAPSVPSETAPTADTPASEAASESAASAAPSDVDVPGVITAPAPENAGDDDDMATVASVPMQTPANVPDLTPSVASSVPETSSAETPTMEAPPAPSLPSVLTPQAVHRAEPTPVAASLPDAGAVSLASAAPITPDPTTAIAWADSAQVKPLLVTSPNALVSQAGPFEVVMDTGDSPAIAFGQPKTLTFSVVNRGDAPFTGRVTLLAPPGWQIKEPPTLGQRQYIAAHGGTLRSDFTLFVLENQGRIDIANTVILRFTPEGGGTPVEVELLLLGAGCWWTVGPFANFDGEGFDRSYMPEDRPGRQESYVSRNMQSVRWEKSAYPEAVMDLEPLFRGGSGVCYGQTILRSPTDREARLVANTNSGVKVWLNGALVLRRFNRETFRPQIGGGPWAVDVTLRAGDNAVMVKWVRGSEPIEFSLTVSDRQGRGLPEVGNTSW